jgi:hypothetical protein
MNRSKLSIALLAAAIAALGFWLWSSRGTDRSDPAAPRPVSKAADPRAEVEPLAAAKGVEEPRQAAQEAASAGQAPAKASAASRDFTVRGHVYVQGTRAPIAGADIAACDAGATSIAENDGEPFARTASDEHGAFELFVAGGAPNLFALLATHDGFAPTRLDTVPGDIHDVDLDIEMGPHFFIGVDVWSPGGRSKVFGADLRLSNAQPAFSENWMQNISDERGHCEFEVTELPRKGLELIVAADGCAPWVMRNLTLEPGVQRRDVICNLQEPRRMRGRVVDAVRRLPIAGAELEIVGRRDDFDTGGGEARSDSNGDFEIDLENCPVEFASVYARAEGYRAARFDGLEHVIPTNREQLVIEMSPPAHMRGKLRTGDGQPLRENSITVAPEGLWVDVHDFGTAEPDGTFDFLLAEVPTGGANVTFEADGYVTKSIVVNALQDVDGLNITLEPAVHLHGRVLNANDSRPLPNLRVRLLSTNGASWVAFADPGGRYSFYAAAKDVAGARLMVEFGGRRLAVSELPAAPNQLDLEHDIAVAIVAPSKGR